MDEIDITAELREEHELILDWVGLIEELAGRSSGSFAESPLASHFERVDAFLEMYSDRLHHAKEEDVLFGPLERVITHCGPIPVMLHEHEIGRALRSRMREAHGARDLEGLLVASADLCELLAQHIAKENQVLYPMAEHGIPAEDRLAIQDAYAAADRRFDARGLRERFERERDALLAEIG